MSRFHIGAKDRNKTQICLFQEGLFHILIALYGSQNICFKGSIVLQGLNQPLPVWSFLFTTSPGPACAASSSGTGHQRKQLSPRSTFLVAGMETSEVLLFCSSQPPLVAARHCPAAGTQSRIPSLVLCPWHGLTCKCCSEPGDGSGSFSVPSFHGTECFAVSQLHAGLNFHGG